MKTKTIALIVLLIITISSSFAYATVTYVMNKTVDQSVTVGETALYTDGLLITLATYDNNTLTYSRDTNAHTQEKQFALMKKTS
jgi:hypothetical protein